MCGRHSLFAPPAVLEERFGAAFAADVTYRPRYNVAPGERTAVVTSEAPGVIDEFRWGLAPPWADDPGDGFVNARSETAAERPAFRDAWASRPCLVLSSGYYEWRASARGPNRPYRFHRGDAPFAVAGLWSVWEGDGAAVPTVTVLTTGPNDLARPIHDRMPVVLPRESEATWLDGGPGERATLCRPYSEGDLTVDPVSTRVNDPANDSPSLVEALGHDQSGLDEFAGD